MKRGIDYIGVGVGALIVDAKGRLFLGQRGPQAQNERGLWELPGGSVEFGETLKNALRREIYEEFGVWIAVGELLDVVDHLLPEEGQHWVSPTFLCTIVDGEPVIQEPEKCSAIGWFYLHELPTPLTQISQKNVDCYSLRYPAQVVPSITAPQPPAHNPAESPDPPPRSSHDHGW